MTKRAALLLALLFLTLPLPGSGGQTLDELLPGRCEWYTLEEVPGSPRFGGVSFASEAPQRPFALTVACALSPEEVLSLLEAETLFSQELEGRTYLYAYSPLLPPGVSLFGREVNLQIAAGGPETLAGWPLIYGSC